VLGSGPVEGNPERARVIKVFSVDGGRLAAQALSVGDALPANALWIDLLDPTPEEDAALDSLTGLAIPTRDEMREIEESSRFYIENDALYMTAPVLHATDTGVPGIAPVTFVVGPRHLVTVRYTSPQPFAFYATRASKQGNALVPDHCDRMTILFGLLEAIVDRLADILENVSARLDAESTRLISGSGNGRPMSTADFRAGLKAIGREGDFLSKVRESLAGLSRLLVYFEANTAVDKKSSSRTWLKTLTRDTNSLSSHVAYLSDRTTFLLDTVVGLVSVEQNAIIKIFSVAAVVFMPPTLVASIYGMNFMHMPELGWLLGYPFAIGAMVLAAVLPLAYFRKRGWL
jgi:magnesium transporter